MKRIGKFLLIVGATAWGTSGWGQQRVAKPENAASVPAVANDAPLPAVSSLMKDVESNAAAMERGQRNYTYHVHTENEELDGKGQLKKTETRDAESFRVNGVLVNRTVAKDGKPLTPDEVKKEDERIDKEVAKAKERKAKLDDEGKASDENGHEELSVARILELGTFSNERRVSVDGRPTIVVDYAGDPKAKTKSRFEAIVRDLVGTVWVDEADRALVQGQGHFLNDFKIGGGLLADVKKGSGFNFRLMKVNGEVWLPAEISGEGKIRVLLVAGFNGRFRLTTSDYKKFRATATILEGNREVGEDGKPVEDGVARPQP